MNFVEPIFATPDGQLRTMIFPGNGRSALEQGFHVDGSSLNLAPIEDSDVLIKPIKERKFVLEGNNGHDTELYPSEIGEQRLSARGLLRKELSILEKEGLSFQVGAELEFYALTSDGKGVDQAAYISPNFPLYPFFKQIIPRFQAKGIPINKVHHEVGAGQYEFVLGADDPQTTADNLLLLKQALKREGSSQGLDIRFSPKPFPKKPGNGLHTHLSLWRDGENLFKGNNELSELGKQFVAGLLDKARDFCGLVAPSPQSYQRLVPGQEAPVHVCWGYKNRSVMVRIPPAKNRVEFRAADPGCNPYLAFLSLIKAGMAGIEEEKELGAPIESNSYQQKGGIPKLPNSAQEARRLMSESSFVREMAPSLVSSAD